MIAILALAIAAAPPPPTVSELVITASKTVSELTVTAAGKCLEPQSSERAERPKVVGSYPAVGAQVRPGLLIVRVTFDRPMACAGAFTDAAPLANPCPGERREMLLSYDRRTVRTVCVVGPGMQYGLWTSRDLTERSFIGLTGLPAVSHRLTFSTSAEPPVTSVCAALTADLQTARQLRERGNPDCPG